MTNWVRTTVRAGGWAVLLATVGVLAATVVVPRFAGAHTYAVMSGSMQPTLQPGSVVVARPVDPEDVSVGSVITFQMKTGKPGVATHRVVAQGVLDDGGRVFRTQGDANDVTDRQWVRPVQIKGEVWYAIPYVGRLTNLLPSDTRHQLALLIAAGLFGYAAVMFTLAIRDRRGFRHA